MRLIFLFILLSIESNIVHAADPLLEAAYSQLMAGSPSSTTNSAGLAMKGLIPKDNAKERNNAPPVKTAADIRRANYALFKAAETGDSNTVISMIRNGGADVNYANIRGETPLHAAAAYGHLGIIRFLVTNKANVNATTITGWSPLLHAARFGYDQSVRELLKSGAQPWQKNRDGKGAIALAEQLGHDHIAQTMRIWVKYH